MSYSHLDYQTNLYYHRKDQVFKYHNDICSRCGEKGGNLVCNPPLRDIQSMSKERFNKFLTEIVLLCSECRGEIQALALRKEIDRIRSSRSQTSLV